MVEMNVLGLTVDPQTKTPIVVLREKTGEIILPIWVGAMEAMAVSLVLHKEDLPRPLTHDLLLLSITALKGELRHVEISDLKDGVYYAVLVLRGPQGDSRVDCRPSDAVALALRADVPILVDAGVLQRSAAAQSEASRRLRREGLDTPASETPEGAVRKAEAHREADHLNSLLVSRGFLPEAARKTEDERLRELLRSLDPVSSRKM